METIKKLSEDSFEISESRCVDREYVLGTINGLERRIETHEKIIQNLTEELKKYQTLIGKE